MTRAELKQIYHLNKELKMWQEELDKVQAEILSSSKLTGMPRKKVISDRVGELASTLADIERIIEGKLTEIQLQRKRIVEYIDSLDDSLLRQIIFYRCVSLMSWHQVAETIGGECTAESVRKYFARGVRDGNTKDVQGGIAQRDEAASG
jgi:predicted  nucleic acid-binding Zn-ribbon protein